MKVALVHDWLTGMRGGERCLEVLCQLFPEADLFTLIHIPGQVSSPIETRKIKTSFLQRAPGARAHYRLFLPLFPLAIENFDLSDYQLVISSSHCVAKGVITRPDSFHLCYCFTPMRYIWDQSHIYFGKGTAVRLFTSLFLHYLRGWDVASSSRVDQFVAISHHVRQRIEKYYKRDAPVIYPPVDTSFFTMGNGKGEDYYLLVSALAPYKRVEVAVEAFEQLGLPLKVIGKGPLEKPLRRMTRKWVEFLGWQPDEVLREHYRACKALIFPGEEDFGLVPLEAASCGRPSIALARGGALESIVPYPNTLSSASSKGRKQRRGAQSEGRQSPTGLFFEEPTVPCLMEAVKSFESISHHFVPEEVRKQALKFDKALFMERMKNFIEKSYEEFLSHAQKV